MTDLYMAAAFDAMNGRFDIYMSERRGHPSVRFVAQPPAMVSVGDGERIDPMLSLKPEEAQMLLDALWRTGLRPNDGTGSGAQVEAMRAHLNDMRAIIGKQLDIRLGDTK